MSRGVNKVILVGNLGQKPEMRYTATQSAVANLSVATTESWKDKESGEMRDKTEWHRVVYFGKLAEIVEKYLDKGSSVYIEGKKVKDKEYFLSKNLVSFFRDSSWPSSHESK